MFRTPSATSVRASLEGNGHRTPSEAFRFEGINLEVGEYARRSCPTLEELYPGTTPWGTSVAQLIRSDHLGVLAAKCGYCGDFLGLKVNCACVGYTHENAEANNDVTLPKRVNR